MSNETAQVLASTKNPDLSEVISNVLFTEANAILTMMDLTGPSLQEAVKKIHSSSGPLIVSGVGKSGHVGRKIASTFCSLGKRAVFLHAAEASHGDLGIIDNGSVVLVLSNSGETTELSDLLAYCREYSVPVVSITASASGTLGKASQVVVAHGKLIEACVNGLAPTTSTTVAMALGDALAVGFSHLSDTQPQDFRRYHPGGKLGARLLKAGDLMHVGAALPVVFPSMPMQEVVIEMSHKGFGIAIVCEANKVIGTITDGDMRRNVDKLWHSCASDLLFHSPKTIQSHTLAAEALLIMNSDSITSIIVAGPQGELCGLLHIHDCLRAGVDQ